MPQLGIDDSRLASVSGVPRDVSSAGIRKATPLMKRKDVAVTISDTTTTDQRAIALGGAVTVVSFAINSCLHALDGPGRRRARDRQEARC
ncbi:hypothetical protein [Mycobacterium sp.]|uniref:hypothetical protein n=1 Tax=Mycobacterium sp. TaxID=1785 RepID=UPI003C730F41